MNNFEYMRRFLPCVTAFFVTMGVVSCGTKPVAEVPVEKGTFRIEGQISEVPDSAVVYLLRSEGRSLEKVATDTLIDGRFTLSDTITRPTCYLLCCRGERFPEWLKNVWVDDGVRVKITGEGHCFGLWSVDSAIEEQAKENRYTEAEREAILQLMQLDSLTGDERMQAYMEGCEQMVRQGYEYMMTAEVDDFWMDKFISHHDIWRTTSRPELDWEKLAARMSEEQRAGEKGLHIESLVHPMKKIEVGDKMPDVTLVDMEGAKHTFAELTRRYVLVDFWGTGCHACASAVPELEAAAEKYGSRLAVVGISVDSRELWQKTVKARNLQGRQWWDTTPVGKSLAVRCGAADSGLPFFVLIAPTGKVADMWEGYREGIISEKLSPYL